MQIEYVYAAGKVKRYHVENIIGEQTVADHSWGVANILVDAFGECVTKEMLLAALWHDVPEKTSGDTPATAKWLSDNLKNALDEVEEKVLHEILPEFPGLSPSERLMVKIADMAELVYFCVRQVKMGNTFSEPIVYRGLDYLCQKDVSILSDREQNYFDMFLVDLRDYVRIELNKGGEQ